MGVHVLRGVESLSGINLATDDVMHKMAKLMKEGCHLQERTHQRSVASLRRGLG